MSYRKIRGETAAPSAVLMKNKLLNQQSLVKKPMVKLTTGLVINKIHSQNKTIMKRSSVPSNVITPLQKTAKYSVQTVASTGTSHTSFQWQQTIGGTSGTTITTSTPKVKQEIGHSLSSVLPANTNLQALSPMNSGNTVLPVGTTFTAVTPQGTTVQVRRPTILLKREISKRTIRSVTMELIEKNPLAHLGIEIAQMPLLKNVISVTANVPLLDCYIVLKKIRQNEDFALLGEYFELSEADVVQTFQQSIVKLSRYLRFLISWPDSKKYYDRHKDLPFSFRSNLSHVQSLIECVETDLPRSLPIECSNYKFILSVTPNGIISYISEAFNGSHDDLTIFKNSNFESAIPKYLSLMADPGKAIRRQSKPKPNAKNSGHSKDKKKAKRGVSNPDTDSTTDSADESAPDDDEDDDDDGRVLSRYDAARVAGELASHTTLNVVNSELTSRKVKDYSIPTMRVREPVCRSQIRQLINSLREFKVLQPLAIHQTPVLIYLNEVLIVAAALTNLQR